MHKWTNDGNTISTGPTPQGELSDLQITIAFVKYNYEQHPKVWNGIRHKVLNNHIIPLIVRVPEMRDTLRELREFLDDLYPFLPLAEREQALKYIERCNALVSPTQDELNARKQGA
jgi:hypothetical protein